MLADDRRMDDRKLTVDDILYAALHDYEDFDLRATCAIHDINPDIVLGELADRLNRRTFFVRDNSISTQNKNDFNF